MKKVSNNKSFVRSKLSRYKSHNTKSFDSDRYEHTKIKKTARGLPHRQLTDFDGESTTVANIFPAQLRASCSAAPADACKPTPLAE